MAKITAFDLHVSEYDNWFVDNRFAFLSELEAIKSLMSQVDGVIEIGIGSGIFAEPLGIKEGVDPSGVMRKRAVQKGLKVLDAVAEKLPYADASINGAIMITSVCFVDDIYQALKEAYRVLVKNGFLILGFVDKDSPVGKEYLIHKEESMFYKEAAFFGAEELYDILLQTGFTVKETQQTIFGKVGEVKEIQAFIKGFGEGSFVVIKAQKENGRSI
ncbi:MAG: SAM-dependent methyltransferase [Bacteroidetes bacterium 4572_77]|nr:MAG: SAM-dependent methyltransferase [Bacteroidetes bacterium 4572_77]